MASRITQLLLSLALVLFLGACTTTAEQTTAQTEPEPVVEIEPWEGDGMQIPMDGSSMEAWERSKARVKAYSAESTYITFENAIQYLLLYDLKSHRDMNKLIAHLDGKTGAQAALHQSVTIRPA